MRFAAFCAALAATVCAAQAAGDAKHGEDIFNRCAQCHTANKGGGNGVGPNLFGVVGRQAVSLPNVYYSPALKKSGIVWTEANLKKWVMNPQQTVPGTRMSFAGLANPKDADDVIAYLKTRK